MVAVTLVCVVLGTWTGRAEYLRRSAVFHDHAAKQIARTIAEEKRIPFDKIEIYLDPLGPFPPKVDERYQSYLRHERLARGFRVACLRPWVVVREPEPWPSLDKDRFYP